MTASHDGTARSWENKIGSQIAELKGHQHIVQSATFSAGGTKVVTASTDGSAIIWNWRGSSQLLKLVGHTGPVTTASFSPNDKHVVSGSDDRTGRVWDSDTGNATRGPARPRRWHLGRKIQSGRGSIPTASYDGTARLWSGSTFELTAVLKGHEDHVLDASFSSDGRRIVTASHDQTARVWDAETGAALLVLRGHEHRVAAAVFDPRETRHDRILGRHRAALGWRNRPISRSPEPSRGLCGCRGLQYGRRTSGDGRNRQECTAVGCGNGQSRLRRFRVTRARSRRSYSARTASDFVTASDDGTARLWDVETSKTIAVLAGHDGAVTTAMFSGSGDALVTGSIDNTARVWRIFPHTQAIVDFAKETASRCLTPEERKQFFLAVEPPRWCITGPSREQVTDIVKWNGKPPYRTEEWTQWLAATDAARAKGQNAPQVPLPGGTINLLTPARDQIRFDR